MNFHFEATSSFSGAMLVLLVVSIIPVKLAAHFVGAERTSLPMCTLAATLAAALAYGAFRLSSDEVSGFLIATLVVVISYKYVLKVGLVHSFLLALVAFGLQLATALSLPGFIKYISSNVPV